MIRQLLGAYLLLLNTFAYGQKCDFTIGGRVRDLSTSEALEFANIYVEEDEVGAVSDSLGHFEIQGLCPGGKHVQISHLGCETQHIYVLLESDTVVQIQLNHHIHVLHEVEIRGARDDLGQSQVRARLSGTDLLNSEGQELTKVITKLPGVSTLSTGGKIGKPIIHGLLGQRIAILQNGINLSSQRWGNDHAPEVGLSMIQTATVVKGTEALEYGGEGLGGAILFDFGPPPFDPHLHGLVNCAFNTNGRGHSVTTKMEKSSGPLSWKTFGGFQKQGDQNTPDYYLTNTGYIGVQGGGLARWTLSKNAFGELGYSVYYQNLGILRGSHIGNVTDLMEAFEREVPFYTQDYFSYRVDAPRQQVSHQFAYLKYHHILYDHWRLKTHYGFQLNNRSEFDVRRGGRSSIPALSMSLYTHDGKASLQYEDNGWTLKSGVQSQWKKNTNHPVTQVLPLLPNYVLSSTGWFSTLKKSIKSTTLEAGFRYDYIHHNAVIWSEDSIMGFKRGFHNWMASVGFYHEKSEHFNYSFNLGFARRPPAINELYSNGLHQGVAGIEEGNRSLTPEEGVKLIGRLGWHTPWHLILEADAYHHIISNYIYLLPESEFRTTIRGAFPVYSMVQNDATLSGMDVRIVAPVGHSWEMTLQGSTVYGWNRDLEEFLLYMPQDQIDLGLSYAMKKGKVALSGSYFFQQDRYPKDVDFLPPPKGYFLLEFNGHLNLNVFKQSVTLFLNGQNLLNHKYRQYLNRWRYFADEPGRNLTLGIRWTY